MKTIHARDTAIVLVITKAEALALSKRLNHSHGFLSKKTKAVISVEQKLIVALEDQRLA